VRGELPRAPAIFGGDGEASRRPLIPPEPDFERGLDGIDA
jgi:hypothetical protein